MDTLKDERTEYWKVIQIDYGDGFETVDSYQLDSNHSFVSKQERKDFVTNYNLYKINEKRPIRTIIQ